MELTPQPTDGGSTGPRLSSQVEKTVAADDGLPTEYRNVLSLDRGAEVGRYVVLSQLGSGGMGVVYSAYDPELDRKIALKVLHPRRAASSRREAARARLIREAQALAQIAHPNVITVHDVGTFHGSVFVAMEFIDGRTLTQWARKKKRSWKRVLDIVLPAGRGLAAAHAGGLVHRDFKPDNVMIGRDGRVVVLDFGLARQAAPDASSSLDAAPIDAIGSVDDDSDPTETLDDLSIRGTSSGDLGASLTRTGGVLGTPAYMAPEQHVGIGTDTRSDQFAFCITLYEALYGQRPFEGETQAALAVEVSEGNVRPPPADTDVPTWLHRVLLRGLEPDPEDRYPTMQALLTALAPAPDSGGGRRWTVPLGATAVVLLGAYALGRPGEGGADVCRGAERHLAGIWDRTQADAVEEAFRATHLPFAERVFEQVDTELDVYADAWTAMRQDACEATHLHGEQSPEMLDRRMLCLDRSLTQLEALVDQLEHADAETMERSVAALSSLPPLARCADVATLMRDEPLLAAGQAGGYRRLREAVRRRPGQARDRAQRRGTGGRRRRARSRPRHRARRVDRPRPAAQRRGPARGRQTHRRRVESLRGLGRGGPCRQSPSASRGGHRNDLFVGCDQGTLPRGPGLGQARPGRRGTGG